MKAYQLKQGKFSSGWRFSLLLGTQSAVIKFKFDERCLYDPAGFDQINKLAGISSGLHHTNSIRLGWMSNGKTIEIHLYQYVDGVRSSSLLMEVNPLEEHEVEIKLPKEPFWGYKLFPYFGGQKPSPHDMTVWVEFK